LEHDALSLSLPVRAVGGLPAAPLPALRIVAVESRRNGTGLSRAVAA